MNEKITGAEALLKSLIAEGVDTIFGYPGGQIITVYDKLYDYTDRLRHILVRHEQGAVHAAQGYARCSGRPGVVIVTSGPGAANVVTGLADALMDSTPLVVISGQVASAFLGTDAFQEADVVAITQQVTKWSIQIRSAEEIPQAVARAFYIASSGRPGPVVLDIAKDAQTSLTEWRHDTCRYIRSYNPRPELRAIDVEKAAEMLNKADRPLILSGHGVMISDAEDALHKVVETGRIPVATTLLGLSTIPSEHPLNLGMLGMHGNMVPNFATNHADVILAVGMRFDDRVTADLSRYARQARVIHVDIDSSELNKNVPAELSVHADAGEFLSALAPLLETRGGTLWTEEFNRVKTAELENVIIPMTSPGKGAMKMAEVVKTVADMAPADSVCVTDVGQNQMFAARYFKFRSKKSFISSGGLGTMGYGLPASIGAKISSPGRQVILFCGDGGLQMTIEEFGTIMQYGVGVKIVVLNNDFLGNVRQWQELFFSRRYSQTHMMNPDFVKLAEAYSIQAETVTSREELSGAVRRMLESENAYLLNVAVDSADNVFPMIPAGGSVDRIMIAPGKYFE